MKSQPQAALVLGLGLLLLAGCARGLQAQGPPANQTGPTTQESAVGPQTERPSQPEAPPTGSEASTPTLTALEKLQQMDPDFVIYFDGSDCQVDLPAQPGTGEHMFLLHNQSERTVTSFVGSIALSKSWEDYLNWYEEKCGPPGSDCDGSCPFMTWYFPVMEARDGDQTRYYLIDLPIEREYVIVLELDYQYSWNCASFRVGAPDN